MLSKLYKQKGDINFNGVEFHLCILKTIPYFEKALEYSGTIVLKTSFICAFLFKKFLYEQEIRSEELTIENVREIKEFSMFLDIPFYTNIKNKLHVKMLKSSSDLQFEYFKEFSISDYRFKFTPAQVETLDKESFHYAICLQDGNGCIKDESKAFSIFDTYKDMNYDFLVEYAFCLNNGTGCEKDEKKAFSIYEKNKDRNELFMYRYAVCLLYGTGCPINVKKARFYLKKNWLENKNAFSLGHYADCLNGEEAYLLYKQNWKENKDPDSLHSLAKALEYGNGCERDIRKAIKLYKKNCYANNYPESLFKYAELLYRHNNEKSFFIHEKNWIVNKHIKSLIKYIHYLEYGIGCEQDLNKARELKVHLK